MIANSSDSRRVVLQLLAGLGADRLDLRDARHRVGAEVGVQRVADLGVEADQRHLVGVLFGAAERLHLCRLDADGLERVRQRLRVNRAVVAQVELVAALGPLELLERGGAFVRQQFLRLLDLLLVEHRDGADAQHEVVLGLAGRVLVLHDVGVVVARVCERLADLAGIDRLRELDDQLGAAAEVDAPVQHVPAALEDEGVEREASPPSASPGRSTDRSSNAACR